MINEKCQLFYPDGTLKAEMFYIQGKLHGLSTFFSTNKQKLTETLYVEGKKDGTATYYYPSGRVASIQRYVAGICDGMQEYWYEDGTVKSLIPYVHGAIHGEVRLFWESGEKKRCCEYAQGVREGWDRAWNAKGILIDEGQFHKGQPIGTHRQFFSSGQIKEEIYYHTPVRCDRKEWSASGVLLLEGKYAPDLTYTERTFLEGSKTEVRKGFWDGQRLRWK